MRIYSAPSWTGLAGESFYTINLSQVDRDFWQAPRVLVEAPFLATASADAGMFREFTKYDVSAIKKSYQVLLTSSEATIIQAMDASDQEEWYVDIGTGLYRCIILFRLSYASGSPMVALDISVIERIS